MTGALLRAAVCHTPRNPFESEGALECFEDGGLLIDKGRIADCGDYSEVRARHPGAAVRDLRGGFLLPGFIDTHVHFPQIGVLGALGRQLLDWLEFVALPEEARMEDMAYACDTARRFVHALAALCMAWLERGLGMVLGAERAKELTRDLVMGARPDAEADLGGAVRDVAAGRLSREEFLLRFGHRGSEEMELSRPRWREDPATLAVSLAGEHVHLPHKAAGVPTLEERLARERLNAAQRDLVLAEVNRLHDYLGLREDDYDTACGFFLRDRLRDHARRRAAKLVVADERQ